MRRLSVEELKRLSTADLEEYHRALEDIYWEAGKDSFHDFCTRVEVPGAPLGDKDNPYSDTITPAAHHKLIIQAVQDLVDGSHGDDIDGVMVFMPPGAAKSTYLSVLAPPWIMGRKPGVDVISTSYAQPLANRNSRRVRQIVRSPEYANIMGVTTAPGIEQIENWECDNGSAYRAAGMTAGITGFRADYALIDDPLKGREDADSQVIRDKVYEILTDDISTRLKPGGKIFVCLTRWHEDDPAGRILGEEWKGQSGLWRGTDGRLWLVINLPLLAEHKDDPLGRKPGELLWPDWFTMKEANRLKEAAKKGGPAARTWASLYQQRPAPNEGAILPRSAWKEWKGADLPECERIYLCYDTAIEEGEENDFSAMSAWGIFPHVSRKTSGAEYKHDHAILLGYWQDKIPAVDLIHTVKEHCKLFQPDRVLVEKRASGAQLVQEMRRQRLPVLPWLPRGKPGSKGKIPRANSISFILHQGSVWYVKGTKTDILLDQCAAFPFGTHDDGVDTVTMALDYFRSKWIFQTADDELEEDELTEELLAASDKRRSTRSLYGNKKGRNKQASLEASDIEVMTPETKDRLFRQHRAR